VPRDARPTASSSRAFGSSRSFSRRVDREEGHPFSGIGCGWAGCTRDQSRKTKAQLTGSRFDGSLDVMNLQAFLWSIPIASFSTVLFLIKRRASVTTCDPAMNKPRLAQGRSETSCPARGRSETPWYARSNFRFPGRAPGGGRTGAVLRTRRLPIVRLVRPGDLATSLATTRPAAKVSPKPRCGLPSDLGGLKTSRLVEITAIRLIRTAG
jgi:hypothetical protein